MQARQNSWLHGRIETLCRGENWHMTHMSSDAGPATGCCCVAWRWRCEGSGSWSSSASIKLMIEWKRDVDDATHWRMIYCSQLKRYRRHRSRSNQMVVTLVIAIALDAMARFDWVKALAEADNRLERECRKVVVMLKSCIADVVGGALVGSGAFNCGTVYANRYIS